MGFRKQLDVVKQILGSWRGDSEMLLPIVEAAAVNPHSFTEELHGNSPDSSRITWYSCCCSELPNHLPSLRNLFLIGPPLCVL